MGFKWVQELRRISTIIFKNILTIVLHNYRASENSEYRIKISKKDNMIVINEGEDLDASDNSLDSSIKNLEDKDKKRKNLK